MHTMMTRKPPRVLDIYRVVRKNRTKFIVSRNFATVSHGVIHQNVPKLIDNMKTERTF